MFHSFLSVHRWVGWVWRLAYKHAPLVIYDRGSAFGGRGACLWREGASASVGVCLQGGVCLWDDWIQTPSNADTTEYGQQAVGMHPP